VFREKGQNGTALLYAVSTRKSSTEAAKKTKRIKYLFAFCRVFPDRRNGVPNMS